MHVNITLKIGLGDQFRQVAGFGGFQFTAVFAQLRWNELKAQLLVNLFFSFAGHALVVFYPDQTVFIERVAQLEGALPQRDIVVF